MPEALFVGGRLDSVRISGSVTDSTTSTHRDTSYTDAALSFTGNPSIFADFFTQSGGVLSPHTVVSGEDLYVHWEMGHSGTNYTTGASLIVIYDSSGYPWVRVRCATSNNVPRIQYNSGTGPSPVWTSIGAGTGLLTSSRKEYDLKVTLGSPHSVEFSVAGSLVDSGTFSQASFTNAAYALLSSDINSGTVFISQIICTEGISTIGAKVWTRRGTADGTNTGWSGAYTDVNEAVGSDASVQSSTSAGQKETHAIADVTISAGQEISSVWHWMRAKNDGSAPTNIKSVIRSGGTDYVTANLSGIGTSYGPVGARYDADPATASNWTQSSFNGIEAGYESAT